MEGALETDSHRCTGTTNAGNAKKRARLAVSSSSSSSPLFSDTMIEMQSAPPPAAAAPLQTVWQRDEAKHVNFRVLADCIGMPGDRLRMDLVRLLPRGSLMSFFKNLRRNGSCVYCKGRRRQITVGKQRVESTALALRLFTNDNDKVADEFFVSSPVLGLATAFEKANTGSSTTFRLKTRCPTGGGGGSCPDDVHCVNPDHMYIGERKVIGTATSAAAAPKPSGLKRRYTDRCRCHSDETECVRHGEQNRARLLQQQQAAATATCAPEETAAVSYLDGVAYMWNSYHDLCERLEHQPLSSGAAASTIRPVAVLFEQDDDDDDDISQWLVPADAETVANWDGRHDGNGTMTDGQ